MLRSLNEIYEHDQLYYWCNASGEINPKDNPMRVGSEEDLPMRECELYEQFWTEGNGCWMYVVDYMDQTGMALCFLCDYSWAADMLQKANREVKDSEKAALYRAAHRVGEDIETWLHRTYESLNCEVWIGKETDPDGHEIMVFIPFEERRIIRKLSEELDQMVYSAIEKDFLKEMGK